MRSVYKQIHGLKKKKCKKKKCAYNIAMHCCFQYYCYYYYFFLHRNDSKKKKKKEKTARLIEMEGKQQLIISIFFLSMNTLITYQYGLQYFFIYNKN